VIPGPGRESALLIESFVRSSRADDVVDAGPSITSPDCIGSGWTKGSPVGAERDRVAEFGKLEDGLRQGGDWYLWGPYVSERQWGTVREDYSADGEAWSYFPHDHARSRAYRWGEDGLAGFCDIEQRLCLGLALWNGRDPILKERAFGLTGAEANHGEDVKEYWWYLDAVPSHAWNRWRYHYPQGAFPYEDLRRENGRRGKLDPEYELLDTGAFDGDRYWIVEVSYSKADTGDILMSVQVTNAGPERDTLHVLPTAWFRNTWSWEVDAPRPGMDATDAGAVAVHHPFLGELELLAGPGPDGAQPDALFCENETNTERLYGSPSVTSYPKDGINDHVLTGAATVSPEQRGTKCAFRHRLSVDGGATVELRLRLRPAGSPLVPSTALGADFDRVVAQRRAEADEFYAELTPAAASADEALVMRQAFAGLLWSKQFYHYDVARWLDGDPTQPEPPASRRSGRNARWHSFDAFDILSMPDKWEYPWFAAWDLAFHCVALAHVDPAFAKYQLRLLCREWFQHPNGALPAYEWDFGDVNPPVQAWAALEVFVIDGCRDLEFLGQVFDKLLVNFTWWVNREDAAGSNLFEGGFLGLDNIGPLDRSHLPVGGRLEQSDATGWMASYALAMAVIALFLHRGGRPASDLVVTFLEHFAAIRRAMDEQGLWNDRDGLFYDRLVTPDGTSVPVEVRSMVGIIPMLAAAVVDESMLDRAERFGKSFAGLLAREGLDDREKLAEAGLLRGRPGERGLLLGVVGTDRLERLFGKLFDEGEFLSPHGLRAISAYHREHPYELVVESVRASIDYEPAESTTDMFGGNSNWRGPLWFPLNHLVIDALERYHRFFGDEFTVEYPTGSGNQLPLDAVVADLRRRLLSIFMVGPDGRRPCFGSVERLQTDPAWKDNLVFNEYFHGDNGAGLGASHQTGWTGIVADLIRRRHGAVPSVGDALRSTRPEGTQA
jgi:Mannosylglycerate hydrolase MGH1-like glycoside hydrolase domain